MVRAYGNSEVVTAAPLSTQVTCPNEDIAIFTELTFEETNRISLWVSSANFGSPTNWFQTQADTKIGPPQRALLDKLF